MNDRDRDSSVTDIDIDRIRNSVEELDKLIPRDKAFVRMTQYGGGPDECQFEANEIGYLRFGIELMKGALTAPDAEWKDGSQGFTLDLGYLVTDDSTINFDYYYRVTEITAFHESSSIKENTLKFGCYLVFIICSCLTGLGAFTVFRWILNYFLNGA